MVIREGWIELSALAIYALVHGALECRLGPAPGSRLHIRRDVRGKNCSEGRGDGSPSRIGLAGVADMADITIADRRQFCAAPVGLFVYARPFAGADRSDRRPPSPGESAQRQDDDYSDRPEQNSSQGHLSRSPRHIQETTHGSSSPRVTYSDIRPTRFGPEPRMRLWTASGNTYRDGTRSSARAGEARRECASGRRS